MITKICFKCKKEKPINEFYKRKDSKDRLRNECIECRKIVVDKHYKNNAVRFKKESKKHRKSNKEYYIEYCGQWRKNNQEYYIMYYQNNKKSLLDQQREYNKTEKGKINEQKKQYKHRQLGFIPLNKPFENCEGHHISENFVIYIPKNIHRGIEHIIWNWHNMEKINKLAFKYL